MRDDVPAAALRLMLALPCITHTRPNPADQRGDNMRRTHWRVKGGKKRVVTGRGRGGNNAKAIEVNGRRFGSCKAVKETFTIGNATLSAWLKTGRARYL